MSQEATMEKTRASREMWFAGLAAMSFMACSEPGPDAVEVREAALDAPPATVSTTATFRDPVGPGVPFWITVCGGDGQPACATAPSVQIRWGEPVTAGQKSGLGYEPPPPSMIPLGTPFSIGALTHINFPVNSGTGATGVRLDIVVNVVSSSGPALFSQTLKVPLLIDETPNAAPCKYPSIVPCADQIRIATQAGGSFTVTVDGFMYELEVLGFENSEGAPISTFISEEGRSTTANLSAIFRATCVDGDADGVCDLEDNCPAAANAD